MDDEYTVKERARELEDFDPITDAPIETHDDMED